MRRLLDLAEERISAMLSEAAQMALRSIELAVEAYRGHVRVEESRSLASSLHRIHDQVAELAIEAIARYQPAAVDLRFLRVAMEASYDLYRIARYSYDISQTVAQIGVRCPSDRVERVADVVGDMLAKSIDMFMRRTVDHFDEIHRKDDVVDRAYTDALMEALGKLDRCSLLETLALRFLERASDHAVYMANRAHYLATGEVKH